MPIAVRSERHLLETMKPLKDFLLQLHLLQKHVESSWLSQEQCGPAFHPPASLPGSGQAAPAQPSSTLACSCMRLRHSMTGVPAARARHENSSIHSTAARLPGRDQDPGLQLATSWLCAVSLALEPFAFRIPSDNIIFFAPFPTITVGKFSQTYLVSSSFCWSFQMSFRN